MQTKNLVILQGRTFKASFRVGTRPIVYKPITGITQTAPAVVTCQAHGVPDGWPAAIVSVRGMTKINASSPSPRPNEYFAATVVDANTLSFDDINAADFKPYTSGGYVQYDTPLDITGYTAAMSIRDRVGGVELLRLDTTNGRIAIDQTNMVVELSVSAADTATITWARGVYDLELTSPAGEVSAPFHGSVSVVPEITA